MARVGRLIGGKPRSRPPVHWSLLVLVAIAASSRADAQALYGFGPVAGEADEYAFGIDAQTGAFTRLASVSAPVVRAGAFDPNGRRLFLLAPPALSFLTVNLNTGEVSSKPSYIIGGSLEYSVNRETLYEIGQAPGSSGSAVYSVNPDNGIGTTIAYLPDGLGPLATSLDDAGRRLFIQGGSSLGPLLVVLDLASGLTTTASIPATSPGFSLQWDGITGTLYGVGSLPGESEASLFRITPGSGNFVPLAHLSDVPIFTSVISPLEGRIFFTSPSRGLSSFDLAGGTINSVSIERCCPALFSGGAVPAAPVPAMAGSAAMILIAALAIVGSLLSRKQV